ncbi:hypothetical protein SD81_001235 [Tolypothrix campylonemoides VB511288]|nr:hypothetical protein SD81_001235 [Tolypothrix campylonemoides VB511288]
MTVSATSKGERRRQKLKGKRKKNKIGHKPSDLSVGKGYSFYFLLFTCFDQSHCAKRTVPNRDCKGMQYPKGDRLLD